MPRQPKRNNKKKNKEQKQLAKQLREKRKNERQPFVSVCTPTFNRRPFFEYAIKNYVEQDYPSSKMEWIIIDDGTDPIGDLVKDIPGVKYFYFKEKMSLGKKRNLMHEKSKGDIIVYMDDDDYYPRDRVSHAVEKLQKNPKALCAGSSAIYIWFKHLPKMFRFGPYGPNHSTAGTFAFRRKLLDITSYDDSAAIAEEKHFLKNYTIPFVQLDPLKTILVFSHIQNTFDKRELLTNWEQNPRIHETDVDVEDFIKDDDVRDFYTNRLDTILSTYEPGELKNKPDVVKQTKEIRKEREKKAKEMMDSKPSNIMIEQDGKQVALTNGQLRDLLQNQQQTIKKLVEENNNLKRELERKQTEIVNLHRSMEVPNQSPQSHQQQQLQQAQLQQSQAQQHSQLQQQAHSVSSNDDFFRITTGNTNPEMINKQTMIQEAINSAIKIANKEKTQEDKLRKINELLGQMGLQMQTQQSNGQITRENEIEETKEGDYDLIMVKNDEEQPEENIHMIIENE